MEFSRLTGSERLPGKLGTPSSPPYPAPPHLQPPPTDLRNEKIKEKKNQTLAIVCAVNNTSVRDLSGGGPGGGGGEVRQGRREGEGLSRRHAARPLNYLEATPSSKAPQPSRPAGPPPSQHGRVSKRGEGK